MSQPPPAASAVKLTVPESVDYQPQNLDFADLAPEIQNALSAEGIVAPTPIQRHGFYPIVQGHDVLGLSQTGSGKTLAFLLPLALKIDLRVLAPQAVILVPTRELADQICKVLTTTLRTCDLKFARIIGGSSYAHQLNRLDQGVHCIIGTPGRVADLVKRGALNLTGADTFVLDEVDQMLDIGFAEELRTIREAVPAGAQTLFFSATLSGATRRLSREFLGAHISIETRATAEERPNIEHRYIPVRPGRKLECLQGALTFFAPKQAIIFCETRNQCTEVAEGLIAAGLSAIALHGDMNLQARFAAIGSFRKGSARFLVATNIAARGIDVRGLPLVVHFDVAENGDVYTHRSGRTGRAGESGRSWTLVQPREFRFYQNTLRRMKLESTRLALPSAEEFSQSLVDRALQAAPVELAEKEQARVEAIVDELPLEALQALSRRTLGLALAAVPPRNLAACQWAENERLPAPPRPRGKFNPYHKKPWQKGSRRPHKLKRAQN